MINIFKTFNKVINVSPLEDKFTSSVRAYTQSNIKQGSSSSVLIENIDESNKITIEKYKKYFLNNDNNPLIYGLKLLDRMSMIISNKSYTGTLELFENKLNVPPSKMKTLPLDQATDVVLDTLEMIIPVKSGVRNGFSIALAFNILSGSIAEEVKIGNKVFSTYNKTTFILGTQTIKEWVYK
jgi:hypothetical protein